MNSKLEIPLQTLLVFTLLLCGFKAPFNGISCAAVFNSLTQLQRLN